MTSSIRPELAAKRTTVVGIIASQTDAPIGARMSALRMKPRDVASDALDAVAAGKSEEIAEGSLTQGAYEPFNADTMAFQARMSTRLPQPSR